MTAGAVEDDKPATANGHNFEDTAKTQDDHIREYAP